MTDPKQPRRRFRLRRLTSFSLRTALVAMTVLAVGLGFHMNSVRKQRASIAAVLRHGGGVSYDYQQDHVQTGYRAQEAVSSMPAWLLSTLGRDHFHDIVWVITKDDGHLKDLTDIEVRSQQDVGAPDDLLQQMDGFSKLQILTLCGTHANVSTETSSKVSDARNDWFIELPPGLKNHPLPIGELPMKVDELNAVASGNRRRLQPRSNRHSNPPKHVRSRRHSNTCGVRSVRRTEVQAGVHNLTKDTPS